MAQTGAEMIQLEGSQIRTSVISTIEAITAILLPPE